MKNRPAEADQVSGRAHRDTAPARASKGVDDILTTTLYHELHNMAVARISEEFGPQTLQATALVHEAWLRMGGDDQPDWANRKQFVAVAAKTMRRILIDRARRRRAIRHGGDQRRVELDAWDWERMEPLSAERQDDALLALDKALSRFSSVDSESAEMIQLHYFGGLKVGEIAGTMGLSHRTAERRLAYGRAWLERALSE